MSKKTVIAVAVSALVCGLWMSSASAKHRHHHMHMHTVAKVETMKPVPGNNPFTVAANASTKSKYDEPKAMPGNNPMPIVKPAK